MPNDTEKLIGSGFYRDANPGAFGPSEWLDLLVACQDGRATCLRVMEIIEREMGLQRPSVDRMVETFLQWRLPESVCADGCTTRTDWPHPRYGTNLLTDAEARKMIEHLLAKEYSGPQTAEATFHDRDVFVNYIADKVNPARLKEGLACISMTAAGVCHDVLTSRRYK